jgi:hypothetical protein
MAKNYRPAPGGTGPSWLSFIGHSTDSLWREFLDQLLFWNGRDLERKLAEFQAYYNAARSHASLEGHTPLAFASGHTAVSADLNHVRWVSHCRSLVQLPDTNSRLTRLASSNASKKHRVASTCRPTIWRFFPSRWATRTGRWREERGRIESEVLLLPYGHFSSLGEARPSILSGV